jgi:hypothetical protein
MNEWGIAIAGVVFSVFGSWLVAKWTANKAIKNEMDKGVVLLWSLIKSYFISCYNCFDKNGNIDRNVNKLNCHLRVIKSIEKDLIQLKDNAYYIDLISKNNNIEMMFVQLSTEIEQQSAMKENEFALNQGTIKCFYEVFGIIECDIPIEAVDEEIKKLIKHIYSIAEKLLIPL